MAVVVDENVTLTEFKRPRHLEARLLARVFLLDTETYRMMTMGQERKTRRMILSSQLN